MKVCDEYLDLVDINDEVIGQSTRKEIYLQGLKNFRTVNLFISNSKREILIPRRSSHKTMFPLGLDFSVGGHVEAGESYWQAIDRELKEELGKIEHLGELRSLGVLSPYKVPISSFSCFFHAHVADSSSLPAIDPREFKEFLWLSVDQALALIQCEQNTHPSKDDLPVALQYFRGLLT